MAASEMLAALDKIPRHVVNGDEVDELSCMSGEHWGGFDRALAPCMRACCWVAESSARRGAAANTALGLKAIQVLTELASTDSSYRFCGRRRVASSSAAGAEIDARSRWELARGRRGA